MTTSDFSNYDLAVEKLDSVIQFSTKYSSKNERIIYDTVLIDDPFKKREVQKHVPERNRGQIIELIHGFEHSLERVSNSRYISKETILDNYKSIINEAIETAMDKEDRKSTEELDSDLSGQSPDPTQANDGDIGVANGSKKSLVPRNQKKEHKAQNSKTDENSKNKKRTSISKDAKAFLENVFSSKRTPNSKERKIIAEKCGLTPVQVRVWFTNKRMRSK